MTTNFLILSGSYVGPDLVAEFGLLPPAFLPLGGARLLNAQMSIATSYTSTVYLSLPENFVLRDHDARYIEDNSIALIRVSPESTLTEGLLNALDAMPPADELIIMYGDTLVNEPHPVPQDCYAVGHSHQIAAWDVVPNTIKRGAFSAERTTSTSEGSIIAGFFRFSSFSVFRSILSRSLDLNDALARYSREVGLTAHPTEYWYDFGHLNTYYNSRRESFISRDFNKLTGVGASILKTGSPSRKIYAEAMWYENLPKSLQRLAPRIEPRRAETPFSYAIEYLPLPLVSELYVYAELPSNAWENILRRCANALAALHNHHPLEHELPFEYSRQFYDQMIVGKSSARLREFLTTRRIDGDVPWTLNATRLPSILELMEILIANIGPTTQSDLAIMHGDFHFGNLFFDFRRDEILAIDPRGMMPDGTLTMFGDRRYDVAKLAHSVIGGYDYIISGRYELERVRPYEMMFEIENTKARKVAQVVFGERFMADAKYDAKEILSLTALLFLSMLPLHAEAPDRQMAILANAYRLYLDCILPC